MCNTLIDTTCASDHLLVGNAAAITNSRVEDRPPAHPLHEAIARFSNQARWRFLDRPEPTSEGVLILLPPCAEQSLNAWHVSRLGKVLALLIPDNPLTEEDYQFIGNPEVNSDALWTWVKGHMTCEFDNSREPLVTALDKQLERWITQTRLLAKQQCIALEQDQQSWLTGREQAYRFTARAILFAMLDQKVVEEVEQDGGEVIPAAYNWLSFPEGAQDYPEAERRMEAFRLDPALIAQYAEVRLFDEDPEAKVHALNRALSDPNLTVDAAVAQFRRVAAAGG